MFIKDLYNHYLIYFIIFVVFLSKSHWFLPFWSHCFLVFVPSANSTHQWDLGIYRKSVKSCLFFCDARIPCRTWIRKVVPTLETHRNADAFVHVFCFI